MKRIGQKIISWVLTVYVMTAIIPLTGITAFAQTGFTVPGTPTVTDAVETISGKKQTVHYFYANGSAVVISENAEGKTIAALQDDNSVNWDISEGYWYVYAGGNSDAALNYENGSITVNGGTVAYIIGSNRTTGIIQNSSVKVTGGEIGCLIVNRGNNGAGAPNYDSRRDYQVVNADVTVSGGTIGAFAGSYGYTYTENILLNVSGGTFTARTSPVQTGIILGGTNGEAKNITLNMTGGTTEGVSLAQRTMITGKATLNLQAGMVGNIFAGSFYNTDEKSGSSWWTSNIGVITITVRQLKLKFQSQRV